MESDTSGDIVVVVLNETDDDIETERWSELVRRALETEGVAAPAEANVVFVDEATIAELNAEHMGKDGPTDVLSFPIDVEWEGGVHDGDVRLVGDIAICLPVAERQAPTHAGTVDDEVALLLVHGTLHLLGHDHAEPDERAIMWAAERRLLTELWRPLTRDPWQES